MNTLHNLELTEKDVEILELALSYLSAHTSELALSISKDAGKVYNQKLDDIQLKLNLISDSIKRNKIINEK